MLDLKKNIGTDTNVLGYALSYVYAPKVTDTVLLLGSDEAVAVWLNGTEIHRKAGFRSVGPDSDAVPCQLQAGWNTVLCKIGQNGWSLESLFAVHGRRWRSQIRYRSNRRIVSGPSTIPRNLLNPRISRILSNFLTYRKSNTPSVSIFMNSSLNL